MSNSDKFFSPEEKTRIQDTIQQIELRTIGEVAVMVVDSSGQYAEAEVLGSLIYGGFISLILTVFFFHSSVWVYIPFSFLFLFLSLPIFKKFPLLKTPLISLRRKDIAVRERAIRAFYEKGLYKTKDNTGVLIFLSLLEHKVWILADKGIYEKIEQDSLNSFANTISNGVKDKRACDSLCKVMQDVGNLLAAHFPVTPDDINELSNEIITE
ncbi:MAG: hypothetical protein HZA08_02305 [Nitrospirae bacterium]|nr:hypothetical protein [Nitrospirota bacterium]